MLYYLVATLYVVTCLILMLVVSLFLFGVLVARLLAGASLRAVPDAA